MIEQIANHLENTEGVELMSAEELKHKQSVVSQMKSAVDSIPKEVLEN